MSNVPQLFMWSDRVLYLGPSFDPVVHQHHAVQICIGIDGPFRIALQGKDEWQTVRAALIGPDTPHQISSQETNMVFLYLENETVDFQGLLQFSEDAKTGILKSEVNEGFLTVLAQASAGCSEIEAKSLGNQILSVFDIALNVRARIDSRIVKVLQMLDQTPSGQCESKILEKVACLSSSRLQHLFREQVGVPIRRYSLWLRLRRVMAQAIEGKTLMDAAHDAGFSDSAHFSRVFKGMFGITPSLLFSAGSSVNLYLSPMK
ncbi:MAG: helix-turn-helix domain-containing protein [Oleispira sp.]|nr:helix-turn-helix domain-containing protein [Oleispira sp.]